MNDKPKPEHQIRLLMDELEKALIAQSQLAQTAMRNNDIELSTDVLLHNAEMIMMIWREIITVLIPIPVKYHMSQEHANRETLIRAQLMKISNDLSYGIRDAMLKMTDNELLG